MAATAGGVAIGSAVGHAVGHALVGGGGGNTVAEQTPVQETAGAPQQYSNPCAQQLDAFLQCAQKNSGDLSLCYGFNEALKDCKVSFGM